MHYEKISILSGKMGALLVYVLLVKSTYYTVLFWYFACFYKGAFACKPFFSSASLTFLQLPLVHLLYSLHVPASLHGIEPRPRNSCLFLGPMLLLMGQCCMASSN